VETPAKQRKQTGKEAAKAKAPPKKARKIAKTPLPEQATPVNSGIAEAAATTPSRQSSRPRQPRLIKDSN